MRKWLSCRCWSPGNEGGIILDWLEAEGVRRTVAWFEADPSRQTIDDEAKQLRDKIIAGYEQAYP